MLLCAACAASGFVLINRIIFKFYRENTMYIFKGQCESEGGTGKRVKTTLKILIFFLQSDTVYGQYKKLRLLSTLIPSVEDYRGQKLSAVCIIYFRG